MIWPGTVLGSLLVSTHRNVCTQLISQQPLGVGTIVIIPILRRRTGKHREGKSLAQGHTGGEWQSQELNAGN